MPTPEEDKSKLGWFGAIDPTPYWNGRFAYEGGLMYTLIDKLKKLVSLLLTR